MWTGAQDILFYRAAGNSARWGGADALHHREYAVLGQLRWTIITTDEAYAAVDVRLLLFIRPIFSNQF